LEGNLSDASQVPPASDFPYSELLYLSGFQKNAYYIISDAEKKVSFRLDWNEDDFPYIWFWQERYGIQDAPWWGKTYSIALEPWTNKWSATPEVDMVKHHWPVLKPFESKTTSLKASVF
jgi:hypothetical protein